ncbi:CDP-glycerol glycerophosphotransferase family protein [uncultured Helicobacter sp.]|uniref:CDP-glycerol glycerophosphotransferase family protein n=1 Tax=uncultured Helicobacter sp. TaxID=175537 RepID=UPI00260F6729|nr:CDP-glycerol glycerophosphotransferase family protein [uncultured Helicobacter sp.]
MFVNLKNNRNVPDLACRVFDTDFKVVLHTGEIGYTALVHLNIWYSYFKESKVKFVILVRKLETFELMVEKYPQANIVYVKTKKEIDEFFNMFSGIKACFYPSNTGNNMSLLYQTQIKHIFIGHGDSDKASSFRKFFRVYDENWIAGDAHRDRFLNAGFSLNGLRFVKVGRPTLKEVLQETDLDWRERFGGDLRLLYLPTWEGLYKEQDYSSLESIRDNLVKIKCLPLELSVKFHPHMGSGKNKFINLDKELQKDNLADIKSVEANVSELIKKTNLFICDISGVVTECLAANAPIFLYMPKEKEIKIAQSNMPYEKYCYLFSSPNELYDGIKNVLMGNDFLAKGRLEAQEYILGKEETLNNVFVKTLKQFEEDMCLE